MEDLIKFYRDINKIKHVERKGWSQIGVSGVRDTIASHSFGATLIGWVLSKRAGFDSDKMTKMLLIHDLIMAHVDDFTPDEKKYKSKREIENEMGEHLISNVPGEIQDEFKELFLEYQAEESEEAKFARECDKLDTLFQAFMYSEDLGRDELSQFLDSYEHKFSSSVGREIFLELRNKKI